MQVARKIQIVSQPLPEPLASGVRLSGAADDSDEGILSFHAACVRAPLPMLDTELAAHALLAD